MPAEKTGQEKVQQLVGSATKRKRAKKLTDNFYGELKKNMCVKKSSGMNTKRGVSCSNILSLLFLFLLGGVAGNIMLLQTTVELGKYSREKNPEWTAAERAVDVYKQAQIIEFKAVIVAMVASFAFGYLYEACSRKCVLISSFVLLAMGMALPFIPALRTGEFAGRVLTVSRIVVGTLVQAIIQNPLLNDYVKRRNRGWASGLQQLGYTIGEIFSFALIALEIHKDPVAADKIYYSMISIIFVLGLFIVIFAVRDRKVPRNYTKDEKGQVARFPRRLEKDDDENDTGSDLEEEQELPPGSTLLKAKKANCWGKFKLILSQEEKLLREDGINWVIFLGSFINKMARDNFGMIVLIWFAQFVVSEEELEFAGPFAMTEKDQSSKYKYVNTIALTAVIFGTPVYGFLNDAFEATGELMIAYGWRAVAGYGMWSIQDPNTDWIIWTVTFFMLAGNFQEVTIDALFSKRLPGDIRAAMIGLRVFFSKLGHFTFAIIAVNTVDKYGIQAGLLSVAIADTFMFVFVFILGLSGCFQRDPHAGSKAKMKGKVVDATKIKAVVEKDKERQKEIDALIAEVKRLKLAIATCPNDHGYLGGEVQMRQLGHLGPGNVSQKQILPLDDQSMISADPGALNSNKVTPINFDSSISQLIESDKKIEAKPVALISDLNDITLPQGGAQGGPNTNIAESDGEEDLLADL